MKKVVALLTIVLLTSCGNGTKSYETKSNDSTICDSTECVIDSCKIDSSLVKIK